MRVLNYSTKKILLIFFHGGRAFTHCFLGQWFNSLLLHQASCVKLLFGEIPDSENLLILQLHHLRVRTREKDYHNLTMPPGYEKVNADFKSTSSGPAV